MFKLKDDDDALVKEEEKLKELEAEFKEMKQIERRGEKTDAQDILSRKITDKKIKIDYLKVLAKKEANQQRKKVNESLKEMIKAKLSKWSQFISLIGTELNFDTLSLLDKVDPSPELLKEVYFQFLKGLFLKCFDTKQSFASISQGFRKIYTETVDELPQGKWLKSDPFISGLQKFINLDQCYNFSLKKSIENFNECLKEQVLAKPEVKKLKAQLLNLQSGFHEFNQETSKLNNSAEVNKKTNELIEKIKQVESLFSQSLDEKFKGLIEYLMRTLKISFVLFYKTNALSKDALSQETRKLMSRLNVESPAEIPDDDTDLANLSEELTLRLLTEFDSFSRTLHCEGKHQNPFDLLEDFERVKKGFIPELMRLINASKFLSVHLKDLYHVILTRKEYFGEQQVRSVFRLHDEYFSFCKLLASEDYASVDISQLSSAYQDYCIKFLETYPKLKAKKSTEELAPIDQIITLGKTITKQFLSFRQRNLKDKVVSFREDIDKSFNEKLLVICKNKLTFLLDCFLKSTDQLSLIYQNTDFFTNFKVYSHYLDKISNVANYLMSQANPDLTSTEYLFFKHQGLFDGLVHAEEQKIEDSKSSFERTYLTFLPLYSVNFLETANEIDSLAFKLISYLDNNERSNNEKKLLDLYKNDERQHFEKVRKSRDNAETYNIFVEIVEIIPKKVLYISCFGTPVNNLSKLDIALIKTSPHGRENMVPLTRDDRNSKITYQISKQDLKYDIEIVFDKEQRSFPGSKLAAGEKDFELALSTVKLKFHCEPSDSIQNRVESKTLAFDYQKYRKELEEKAMNTNISNRQDFENSLLSKFIATVEYILTKSKCDLRAAISENTLGSNKTLKSLNEMSIDLDSTYHKLLEETNRSDLFFYQNKGELVAKLKKKINELIEAYLGLKKGLNDAQLVVTNICLRSVYVKLVKNLGIKDQREIDKDLTQIMEIYNDLKSQKLFSHSTKIRETQFLKEINWSASFVGKQKKELFNALESLIKLMVPIDRVPLFDLEGIFSQISDVASTFISIAEKDETIILSKNLFLIDFGTICLNDELTHVVYLKNDTDSPLDLEFTKSDNFNEIFKLNETHLNEIEPDQEIVLRLFVKSQKKLIGEYESTFGIRLSREGRLEESIFFKLNVQVAWIDLEMSEDSIDFGDVLACSETNEQETITLFNKTNSLMTLSALIQAHNSQYFILSESMCMIRPRTSKKFTVTLKPDQNLAKIEANLLFKWRSNGHDNSKIVKIKANTQKPDIKVYDQNGLEIQRLQILSISNTDQQFYYLKLQNKSPFSARIHVYSNANVYTYELIELLNLTSNSFKHLKVSCIFNHCTFTLQSFPSQQ